MNFGQKGIRCQVCTGCGRCQGVERMHILTKRLRLFDVNLQNDKGKRLITADIGTTTIAMQLHKEDGSVADSYVALNPQSVYGADVISRISAARTAAKDMQRMVEEELKKGIRRFRARLTAGESLYMVLAANTTMIYLLMGWDTEELGRAPFYASHLEGVITKLDGIRVYLVPGLSAFVGGDITAGIYAGGMLNSRTLSLLVDLGTNGEIVLGNSERLLACATAAGPAFEGGVNRGVWGSDMVQFLAMLRKRRILDETGLLAEKYFATGVRIGNVCVTQGAVRAIQLAKAAIAAGIEILCSQYGCAYEDIGQVILAGGFGYYLNPKSAVEIGLLPKALEEKAMAGGNTALAGALQIGERILRGENAEKAFAKVDIRKQKGLLTEVINLAEQKEFSERYLEAMSL